MPSSSDHKNHATSNSSAGEMQLQVIKMDDDQNSPPEMVPPVTPTPFQLPPGWLVEIKHRPRRCINKTPDKFYYEPDTGRKFRSLTSVKRYLSGGKESLPKPREVKTEEDDTMTLEMMMRVVRSYKKSVTRQKDAELEVLGGPPNPRALRKRKRKRAEGALVKKIAAVGSGDAERAHTVTPPETLVREDGENRFNKLGEAVAKAAAKRREAEAESVRAKNALERIEEELEKDKEVGENHPVVKALREELERVKSQYEKVVAGEKTASDELVHLRTEVALRGEMDSKIALLTQEKLLLSDEVQGVRARLVEFERKIADLEKSCREKDEEIANIQGQPSLSEASVGCWLRGPEGKAFIAQWLKTKDGEDIIYDMLSSSLSLGLI